MSDVQSFQKLTSLGCLTGHKPAVLSKPTRNSLNYHKRTVYEMFVSDPNAAAAPAPYPLQSGQPQQMQMPPAGSSP